MTGLTVHRPGKSDAWRHCPENPMDFSGRKIQARVCSENSGISSNKTWLFPGYLEHSGVLGVRKNGTQKKKEEE
jgi:hypothetical protein